MCTLNYAPKRKLLDERGKKKKERKRGGGLREVVEWTAAVLMRG